MMNDVFDTNQVTFKGNVSTSPLDEILKQIQIVDVQSTLPPFQPFLPSTSFPQIDKARASIRLPHPNHVTRNIRSKSIALKPQQQIQLQASNQTEDKEPSSAVKQFLSKREAEFLESRTVKVAIGTWNVNSQQPDLHQLSLSQWLHLHEPHYPDLLLIGLQEIDMSAQSITFFESVAKNSWLQLLQTCLWEHEYNGVEYQLLECKQLGGCLLVAFISSHLKPHVKHVKCCGVPLGKRVATTKLGNKGAIALKITLFEEYNTFTFVNCHFHAHQMEVAKRNKNYAEVCKTLTEEMMDDSDYMFWFGDLNYRIDNLDFENVIQLSQHPSTIPQLLAQDQLSQQILNQQSFVNYQEATISFAPTYKFVPLSLQFDQSKQRIPSYCDRILFSGKRVASVVPLQYGRYDLPLSDHLPVSALYEVRNVMKPIPNKLKQLMIQLSQELNPHSNLNTNLSPPILSLSSEVVIFDKVVSFGDSMEQTLVLKNGCKNPNQILQYAFIPKEGSDERFPNWLQLEPFEGLLTHQNSQTIKLKLHISKLACKELNRYQSVKNGIVELNETIICHVEMGRSYFIRIRAMYQKSVMANSLDQLILLGQRPLLSSHISHQHVLNKKLFIPKEVFRLVDTLFKHGMRLENIFLKSSPQQEWELPVVLQMVHLDQPIDLSQYEDSIIYTAAQCLLQFCRQLQEPIIAPHLYRQCIASGITERKAITFLEQQVPPLHYNVFIYIMSFLRELLLNSDANRLTPYLIEKCFAPVLIHSPKAFANETKYRMRFLRVFLRETPSISTLRYKSF